jgi:predicted nuclease of predicted toxin-antitoxin system
MRAKIDENMPVDAVAVLREAGWETSTVYDEALAGADDDRVAAACRLDDRVLVTLDLDFADIRMYPPEEHAGIIVLRPVDPDRDRVLALLRKVIPFFAVEAVRRRLWIVEPDRIRIRGGSAAEG